MCKTKCINIFRWTVRQRAVSNFITAKYGFNSFMPAYYIRIELMISIHRRWRFHELCIHDIDFQTFAFWQKHSFNFGNLWYGAAWVRSAEIHPMHNYLFMIIFCEHVPREMPQILWLIIMIIILATRLKAKENWARKLSKNHSLNGNTQRKPPQLLRHLYPILYKRRAGPTVHWHIIWYVFCFH